MSEKITQKQVEEAETVLLKYFFQMNENNKSTRPITLLDTTIHIDEQQFRLLTFFTFYGRDERPIIEDDLDEQQIDDLQKQIDELEREIKP